MSAINPDEIISILKEEIENYDEISQIQEVVTVISVGDGIATVYGIDHAMYGEVVVFENGLMGLVQDIRTNSMGCILFGKDTGSKEGTILYQNIEKLFSKNALPLQDILPQLFQKLTNPETRDEVPSLLNTSLTSVLSQDISLTQYLTACISFLIELISCLKDLSLPE